MEPRARAAAPRAPASERVVEAVASGFAGSTLCCHAVVWAGGALHQAMGAFALDKVVVAPVKATT